MEISKKKTIIATQSLQNLSSLKQIPTISALEPPSKKIHKQNPIFLTNSKFFYQFLTKKAQSKGPLSACGRNIKEIVENLWNLLEKSDKSRVYFPEDLMSCIYTVFKNPNSFSSKNVENLPLIQRNPRNNVPLSSFFPYSDATKDFQYQWLEILVKRRFEDADLQGNPKENREIQGNSQQNGQIGQISKKNLIIQGISEGNRENIEKSPEKARISVKIQGNSRKTREVAMQNPKSFENLSKIIKIEPPKLEKLFFQCSENLRTFMGFLKSKEKKLLWSELEDKVLRIGRENNELAYELLRFYKGDEKKLKERELFLKKIDEKKNSLL